MPKPDTIPQKHSALLGKIAQAFPELRWDDYRYIDEGWDHEVIILDNRIVFRFPTDQEYLGKLLTELKVLKYLALAVNISVPTYAYVPTPLSFAGYPIVPGAALSKPVFDNLSVTDRADIATQLAEFLSLIHQKDIPHEPFRSVSNSVLYEDQKITRDSANIYLKSSLTQADFKIVERILADVDALLRLDLPRVFIHNDIYDRHLLWDKQKHKLGLIDFSDMSLGDPAVDFGELHEYGFDFVNEVYKLYSGPKDSTFLARAWTHQEWAAVYMLSDYYEYHKTTFEVARKTFDRVKQQQQTRAAPKNPIF